MSHFNGITLKRLKERPDVAKHFFGKLVHIYNGGDVRMYWRPNAAGYTRSLAEAGQYQFIEAVEMTSHCGPEKAVEYRLVSHAELHATDLERHVDDLQKQITALQIERKAHKATMEWLGGLYQDMVKQNPPPIMPPLNNVIMEIGAILNGQQPANQ